MAYSFGCSASRPFGNTPQGARGESRKRLSPFLIQPLHLYALVTQAALSAARPHARSRGTTRAPPFRSRTTILTPVYSANTGNRHPCSVGPHREARPPPRTRYPHPHQTE